jgi:hypothetical protein
MIKVYWETFLPICFIFINQFGYQCPNKLVSVFNLPIFVWIIGGGTNMFQHETIGIIFDGIINKMHTLINDYG